jgi:hypothetical protein
MECSGRWVRCREGPELRSLCAGHRYRRRAMSCPILVPGSLLRCRKSATSMVVIVQNSSTKVAILALTSSREQTFDHRL